MGCGSAAYHDAEEPDDLAAGVSYVLVYLIRIALNDWGNIWLTESHGVNLLRRQRQGDAV